MQARLWKRNAVVAVVALFLCAGIYLNWSYNQTGDAAEAKTASGPAELADTLDTKLLAEAAREADAPEDGQTKSVDALTEDVVVLDETAYDAVLTEADTDTSMTDYFAAIRMARQESRDSAADLLQETIAYETGADETAASAASVRLEEMVSTALQEAEIEGLVIAKGYEDCVAYMTEDGISIAVSAPEEGLKDSDVALISDVVTGQTDYDLTDIRIIEVK